VYALLALYLLEVRGQRGPIVKTLSTTSMLNKLGELYHVPVYETGVGFKYVAPKMIETDAMIGGEESGGYAFKGNVPERDGILGNLLFLDFMVKTGKKPSQLLDLLFAKVGAHYYDRIDRPFSGDRQAREKMILDAVNRFPGSWRATAIEFVTEPRQFAAAPSPASPRIAHRAGSHSENLAAGQIGDERLREAFNESEQKYFARQEEAGK